MSPRNLAALLLLAGGAAAHGETTIGIIPAVAYFTAQGGQVAAQTFTLSNDGDDEVRFTLQRTDLSLAPDGKLSYPAPGTSPHGLGAWLSKPPNELVVPAHGAASFDATALVPGDAAPGTYFGGYLALLDDQPAVEKRRARKGIRTEVHVASRLALLMHVNVVGPGARPALGLQVSDAGLVPPTSSQPLAVRIELDNPSAFEALPVGTLAVFDGTGAPLGKAVFNPGGLWPGKRRWYEAGLALPANPGTYQALAVFELDGVPVATKQLSFSVPAEVEPGAPKPGRAVQAR